MELKPQIPFLDLLIQYSWLLEQVEEEDDEEEGDQESLMRLPTPSNDVMNQVLEKLDLLNITMESIIQSLEKSVDDKYNNVHDCLLDIENKLSYHGFKLQEYFKATGHDNLLSPSPLRHTTPSPPNSPT